MEFERGKKVGTNLNIAPLIDVVFLLLIFFMLSPHFVSNPGIKLDLPKSVASKLHSEEDVVVFIASDEEIYLNEEKVTMEGLLYRLKIKLADTAKKTVIIKADERIDLGVAVKVMDIARQAEAEGLVISTQMKEDVKR